jgi:long-chain acyl-CoA synthetase
MLTSALEKSVRTNPTKVAIVRGSARISYGELYRQVRRCAAAFRDLDVREGDCVGAMLDNGPEFIAAFLACANVHAIFLPISSLYTREEVQKLLLDAGPRLILAQDRHLARCRDVAAKARFEIAVLVADDLARGAFDAASIEDMPSIATAAEPFTGRALYLYTSGSTDSVKRVCCTQENLYFEAHNFVESTKIGADDTILCTIPLHHSYGFGNCLLDALYTGATLVLEPDSDQPFAARHGRMLELLRAEEVKVYPGVPFQFEVLAASPKDVASAFRHVRWCISSGDVLARRTFDRFRARTGHPIRSLYGSTEAGSIAMDVGDASAVSFGSLGPPLANVTIEVRGDAGRIWVKSPCIPPDGYDNRPEINREVFREGFYDTGDVGTIDDRGHLVMTGRKQSFFDVGGHKVELAEVEEILLGHAAVREAAVVGVEIPNLGAVIKAVVVADEACHEADILDHCRAHLAAFKIPRFVEFRNVLPRSALGKILKHELADSNAWLADVPSARDIPRGSREQQIDWLALRIREQVATILGTSAARIRRDVPFQMLGFDSLRTIELQERLSRMSGMALSVTTLWNYPSIDAYAAFLLDAMRGPAAAQHLSPPSRTADPLDELSDDAIAAMLAKEIDMK